MPYWDRFDIVEAYYLYSMRWHTGQWSKEYALTGTFGRIRFRPSPMLERPRDLTDNGLAIYNRLVRTKGRTIRDRRL